MGANSQPAFGCRDANLGGGNDEGSLAQEETGVCRRSSGRDFCVKMEILVSYSRQLLMLILVGVITVTVLESEYMERAIVDPLRWGREKDPR